MKKTLNINIRGTVFHIDEDAYEKLNKYLSEINHHFKSKKGHEDIINDIENRIVELFQQKLSDKKQVIVIEDVEEVIGTMGHPSDFDQDSEEESIPYTKTKAKGPKRLFRDIDNRLVGGVCSGLGAYFNVDQLWFRIAFIVSVFIGGAGVIVYLIIWIITPPAITVSEKLEMQGDPVTISNMEKAFKEEMSELKDKLDDLTEQAKQTFKKKK
jgi:phage shock protein PspC (stress-responsive transcriptional regulator)